MAVLPRPSAKTLVSLVALAGLAAPSVVALATGWIEVRISPWGEPPGPDPTSIESWVALALVYLVWAPLVFVGLVVVLDRLGYKYMPVERTPRPTRRSRRRQVAGIKLLQARDASPSDARKALPKRRADGR